MSNKNIFLRDDKFYQRDISPVKHYVDQTSFYLSKMSGQPLETCKTRVMDSLKGPEAVMKDPTVTFMRRDPGSRDAEVEQLTLSEYIGDVIGNGEILAPTFTSYLHTTQRKSLLAEFIDANLKGRSKAKKEAFKAEADGNIPLFIAKNNEQLNKKLYNNSMSGAFASKSSVLYNPSAHSTLTSITRTVSSIGNSSNEKIIAGNRHYFSPDVTLYNVICLSSGVERDKLRAVIEKYGLVYPSAAETMECLQYSTDLYWRDNEKLAEISALVYKLESIERAAVVYVGDLYHIRKLNDDCVRMMLTKLAKKVTGVVVDDAINVVRSTDEQIANFAHIVCSAEVRGRGKDYERLSDVDVSTLAATCLNITNTVIDYRDFIEAIFLSNNTPASMAHIPNMVRRAVVLSDTDSTMFSTDEYVSWYFGSLSFSDEAVAIGGAVMFLATQCISHILAIFSANMNVSREHLFTLAMKPEFGFSVFAQSSVSKHYFTSIDIKEGNVFDKPKLEIKGVHLKNSANPKNLVRAAQERMSSILATIRNGDRIKLKDELRYVADVERKIIQSLTAGEVEFYKSSKIKDPEGYANVPERSPYLHHMLWNDVFKPKYGPIDPPPYGVIKVPTTLNNRTSLLAWVESIEDRELAENLRSWLIQYQKPSLPTMYLSVDYVKAFGIPSEIVPVINIHKILLDLTNINRMTLETLGYFPKDGLLLSEQGY